MNVTRQHVRHKLPVQVFYNNQHLKLIDFSLGGAGAELGKIDPPEANNTIKLILIFPYWRKCGLGNFCKSSKSRQK